MRLFWRRKIEYSEMYLQTLKWAQQNRVECADWHGCPCRGPYWITGGDAHRKSEVHRRWADGTEPGSGGVKHPDLSQQEEWARDDANWAKTRRIIEQEGPATIAAKEF